MPLNYGAGEDSWKSLREQKDQTSQSQGRSTLNIHWKDWWWSSSILVIWCEQMIHWKSPWCWERLRAEGEEGFRRRDGWWHHWCNELEFEQTPGDGEGRGGLVCCSPWGPKVSDMTEWLNWNDAPLCAQAKFTRELGSLCLKDLASKYNNNNFGSIYTSCRWSVKNICP